jgi:hypothetical protein
MTAVHVVVDPAVPFNAGPAGAPPALDARRAQAAGAAWAAVFDRAREDARRPDGQAETISNGRPDTGASPGWRVGVPALRIDATATASREAINADAPPIPAAGEAASEAGPGPFEQPGALRAVGRPEPAFVSGPSPALQRAAMLPATSRLAGGPARAMTTPAAVDASPPTDPAPERVSVFVDEGAIAIAVRDGVVSDGDALQAAFETARQVAGQGRALRQLTLNGRVLYRRPEAGHGPAPDPGSFAC